jgi:hypothetical protein
MNNKLSAKDLFSLEEYARRRPEFRARVMEHKAHRRLQLGPHLTLCFEDRLTMQYQIQEMLRVERIFEEAEIRTELDTYNPLIPDGTNWKATLLIEYPDPDERRVALAQLRGIELAVSLRVEGFPLVRPVADEDLERTTEEKTSSVHFLRFDLTADMIRALKEGAALAAGVDHASYSFALQDVPEILRESLVADLA